MKTRTQAVYVVPNTKGSTFNDRDTDFPYLTHSGPRPRLRAKRPKRRGPIAETYALALTELNRLFVEFGLDIHRQDMINISGYSARHFRRLWGGQRNVILALVGEEFLNFWEGILLSKLRKRLEEQRQVEDLPDDWDRSWEALKEHGLTDPLKVYVNGEEEIGRTTPQVRDRDIR